MFHIRRFRVLPFCMVAAFSALPALAQVQPPSGSPQPPAGQTPSNLNQPINPSPSNQAPAIGGQTSRELPPDSIRPNYVLAPNDQILIRTQAEEINEKPFRID